MNKKNVEAIYPLSPMQQGMLFDTLYAPRSGVYITQWVSSLHGDLDVLALKHAWQQVTDRHSVLRTLFSWEKLDSPHQIVLQHVSLPWAELDWRAVPSGEQAERLEAFLQMERIQGFELTQPPLFRLTLILLAEGVYQLIWSSHHLLLDGWSSPLVIREVLSLYEAERLGRQLHLEASRPYRDYITWLQRQDLSKAEAFWRRTLEGFTATTPLGVERVTSRTPIGGGGEEANNVVERLRLSLKTTLALQSLARQHRLTLNTLIQGAWALLLSSYSGEEDVVFGVVVSARPSDLKGVESMVGSFINTLPLRVHISPDVPLISWLQDIQARHIEARQYEYSSLIQVRAWSEVPMDQPLFESLLVFENRSLTVSSRTQEGGLEVYNARTFERTRVPLLVEVIPEAELCIQIGYDTGHFENVTIIRMLEHYQNLLEGFVAHPEQQLVNISPLTRDERRQILLDWNPPLDPAPLFSAPFSTSLHALVETQTHLRPDAVALCFQDEHLSYAALNARSNQLARFLLSLSLPPSRPLALLLFSPVLQVLSLLAILKAGYPFVCLDPAAPHTRLLHLLSESDASCLLSQESCLLELPSFFQPLSQSGSPHLLLLDLPESCVSSLGLHLSYCSGCDHLERMAVHNPNLPILPTDPAYLVWTSGSTGSPKSMFHTHQTLVQFLFWFASQFQITSQSRIAQWASLNFDAAYVEIFSSLTSGATLCLAAPLTRADPASLTRWLAHEQVTLWQTVPSFLRHVLPLLSSQRDAWRPPFPHLQFLLLAGEVLPVMLVQQAMQQLGKCVRMVNLYGPTEAILATFQPLEIVSPQQPGIPVGRPIAGRQVLVLDRWQRLCPIGVKGELYLRSPFLTQGYVGRPAESARAFVPDILEEGANGRLYRTGDMGRWRADGILEFEGRLDRQVKIRGIRVELEEVEAALSACTGVTACAVVTREEEGEISLAGYLVLGGVAVAEEGEGTEELLRRVEEEMRRQVPGALVPSHWMLVDEVPRTLSGKVDRLALEKQKGGKRTTSVVAPRTPLEEMLIQIWKEVLKQTQVGVTDNFFILGGHSLLVTQVMVRVRRTFKIDLLPRDLFEAPTIAQLAERVQMACQSRDVKAERIAQLLEQLQQLSDDEASSMLARKRFENEDHR